MNSVFASVLRTPSYQITVAEFIEASVAEPVEASVAELVEASVAEFIEASVANPITPYLLYGYCYRTYVCIKLLLVISLKYNYFLFFY